MSRPLEVLYLEYEELVKRGGLVRGGSAVDDREDKVLGARRIYRGGTELHGNARGRSAVGNECRQEVECAARLYRVQFESRHELLTVRGASRGEIEIVSA